MNKAYIPGIVAALALLRIAAGWGAPLTYSAYSPSEDPAWYWAGKSQTRARELLPLIPDRLPGPLDAWAGGARKTIILEAPANATVMEIAFADAHESAPPLIRAQAGEMALAEFRLPKGTGGKGEKSDIPFHIQKVRMTAKQLASSGGLVSISTENGSWAALHSITFRSALPIWETLIGAIAIGLSIYFLLRPSPMKAREAPAQEGQRAILSVFATVSLILAILLPGSNLGVLDGLPLGALEETLVMMVAIPALIIFGPGFFRLPWPAGAAFGLLVIKVALWMGAPAGGIAIKIYDTPSQATSGNFQRTYDTLMHPGMSARITAPLVEGSRFPVDWLWRRDSRFTAISYPYEKAAREPYQGGHWIAVHIEGWVTPPPGMKLAFMTVGAEKGTIRATSPDGTEKEYKTAAADQESFLPDQLLPSGVTRISGDFIFTLEAARHYALAAALVAQDGGTGDAIAGGSVWMDEGSARSSSIRRWMARTGATLVDWGVPALLVWWGLWSLASLRIRGEASPALLVAGLLVAMAPFTLDGVDLASGSVAAVAVIPLMVAGVLAYWVRAMATEVGADKQTALLSALAGGLAGAALWPILVDDCGGGGWTPVGVSALAGSVLYIHWLKVRSGSHGSDPRSAGALFIGMMIFPWFLWKWRGLTGAFFPYDDLSDSLTYQAFAREIWVGGDWWHAAGEPIFFYQPGYRYIVGALHALFGQSPLAQNILELWAILVTCVALGAIGRWAGLGPRASAVAPFAYLALLSGPHFLPHVGLGMQELTANLFLFGGIILVLRSGGDPWRIALAGVVAVLGFWLRFDRLGVLAAAVIFLINPAGGSVGQAWGILYRQFLDKWKPVTIYLSILAAAVAAVALRNYVFGGELALLYRENMDLLVCRDLACSLRGYRQILAGSISCVDRAGVVMIAGVAGALMAMVIRPRWMRGAPVSMGLLLLGLLSPYYMGGPTNFEPKFSQHLLPLAAVSLVLAYHSILTRNRG